MDDRGIEHKMHYASFRAELMDKLGEGTSPSPKAPIIVERVCPLCKGLLDRGDQITKYKGDECHIYCVRKKLKLY